MNISDFTGTWELSNYRRDESVAELGDEGPDYTAIGNWINGDSVTLLDDTSEAKGLKLVINSDGSFEETNTQTPDIEWFNNEGVLDSQVSTFSGAITLGRSKASLLAKDTPSWAEPDEDQYDAKCRFDDGDMLICDHIQLIDGNLIRTMNSVSDEEHLYRSSLIYTPS